MLTLPDAILPVLHPFAMLFRSPTWLKAQILLAGAILAPGQRTVAAALRVMGRSDHLDYACYHEALNRAVWPPRQAARILLMLLLQHLDQGDGPLVFGIDETLGRRRGPKIESPGIYRDAVCSSRSHLVKASGLRWVSLMWLGQIPWAERYWALPFLTVLAPSERYYRQRGRRHKKLIDWARRMVLQLRRWLPHRPLVLVGDSGYAVPVSWHGDGSGPAPLLPIVGSTRYPHRPPAPGRRPLCASATPSDGPERPASAERPAAARAEGTPGLARRVMERGAGSLVRRHYPHGGTHVANGGLVPLGQAACAPALGLGSGPTGRIHSPGLALHRSVGGPGADPGMVCAALATGGHPVSSTGQALSGGAGSPGCGDPTPVAGSSHCPYYANPDGTLLLDHPGGPSAAATTTLGPSHSGLVRQAAADLRGCHRSGAPPLVAGVRGFFTVRRRP